MGRLAQARRLGCDPGQPGLWKKPRQRGIRGSKGLPAGQSSG